MTLLVGSIFHMTREIVSEMTYNVSMGTLNPTIHTYIHILTLTRRCVQKQVIEVKVTLYVTDTETEAR